MQQSRSADASTNAGERRGRTTIRDVARRAGVSQTTVSFVLNDVDGGRIAPETRERVWRAARALGYQHNRAPRRQPSTKTIGMLIDEVATSPMNALSIDGAQQAATERGWLVVIGKTSGAAAYERAYLERWRSKGIDGIILSSILTRSVSLPLGFWGGPLVLLNCHDPASNLPAILPNDVGGAQTATEALLRTGHRRIGFINGEAWTEAARDRFDGYCRALALYGVPLDPRLVVGGDFMPTSARIAATRLMTSSSPPSAIFCASDLMALGAYDAIKARGLSIPRDVAVIGFDDRELAQHLDPPLTTVRLPHEEMGRLAATALIDGSLPASAKRPQVVECVLVERASA